MKKYFLYKPLFFILLLAGCNKIDLPDPVDGTPVFSLSVSFENNVAPIDWKAGIDSIYMFTDFQKDAQDIHRFIGKMEREDCAPECKESFSIIIYDDTAATQNPVNIDEALAKERYLYTDLQSTNFELVFDTTYHFPAIFSSENSTFGFGQTEFFWEFSNGFSTAEANVEFTFDTITPNTSVSLTITDLSGGDSCVSFQKQYIKLPNEPSCSVSILPEYEDTMLLRLTAKAFGNGQVIYDWGAGLTDLEFIDGPFQPFQRYGVTITDDTECQAEAAFIPLVYSSNITPAACVADFSYEISAEIKSIEIDTIFTSAPVLLSSVIIIYTDKDGNIFRSDRNTQNSNSVFQITGVQDFDKNENGQPTKKLDLIFNCELWDENGNKITISEGTATWGIAYPEG